MKLDISKITRYEYIETRLFWEDGLTAGDIARTFGLSRQAGQAVIESYRRGYPDQMEYDPSLKRHVATEAFEPAFIGTDPMRFLDYLRGETLTGNYRDEPGWSDIEVTDVERLLMPKLSLCPIKTVVAALHRRQVVSIDYRQKDMEPGSLTTRPISPNHLVFADSRYHIRAYCHRKNHHLDFVLSRIVQAELAHHLDWVSSREDREWNRYADLCFVPNPDLPESVQSAILRNYEVRDGVRMIRSRKALAFYVTRKLTDTVDPKYGMPLWKLEKKY